MKFEEFELFLLNHKDRLQEDIGTILRRLDIIKKEGCFERYFRYVGKKKDALPYPLIF